MEERRRSSRRSIRERNRPDIYENPADEQPEVASDFIFHYADIARQRPGKPAARYGRVSTPSQLANGNLASYAILCQDAIELLDGVVGPFFGEQAKGWQTAAEDRAQLVAAIAWAKPRNGVVVAPTLSRLLRHFGWRPNNRNVRPMFAQYQALMKLAGDVPLCTIEHPDAPDSEEHGLATSAGQTVRSRRGGRPQNCEPRDTVAYRELWLPEVLGLRAAGSSLREIEEETGVALSTLHRWILANKEVSHFLPTGDEREGD